MIFPNTFYRVSAKALISFLPLLMVLVFLVGFWLAIKRNRRAGDYYWEAAASRLNMKYDYKFKIMFKRNSHLYFSSLGQFFPIMIDELKPFLLVLNNRAHILSPVRVLSGTYRGREVVLMQATGGFKWRVSLLPA